MNTLHIIPPPIFSDGKIEIIQNAISQGWERQDGLIPSFFKQIEPQLIELLRQYPEQMNPPCIQNSFHFAPSAPVISLPENYALLTKENNVIVVGHPRWIKVDLVAKCFVLVWKCFLI
jgi:hypothetical protein